MIYPSFKIYCTDSKSESGERGVFASVNIDKDEIIERCPIAIIQDVPVCLGFGSLYRFSEEPNALYEKFPGEKLVKFIAAQDIKKDEEITIGTKVEPFSTT